MTWLLAILLPFLIPVITLPNPTGTFNVGSKIYDWTDSSRAEWFTNEPLDFRNIVVQVWYPSEVYNFSEPLPYLDHVKLRAKAIGDRVGLPSFMLSHLALVETNSYNNTLCGKIHHEETVIDFGNAIVQIKDTLNDTYEFAELMMVDDDNRVFMTEYGNIVTGAGATTGIGTISGVKGGHGDCDTEIKFVPNANIPVEVKTFIQALNSKNNHACLF